MFPDYSQRFVERVKVIRQIIQEGISASGGGSKGSESLLSLMKDNHLQAKIAIVMILQQKR